MKTIGIPVNLPAHGTFTGVERYIIELIRAMIHLSLPADTQIILYSATPLTLFGALPKGWVNVVIPWRFKSWTHVRLSAYFLRHAPDILFVPIHEIPLYTGKARIVATVHDLAFAYIPTVYAKRDVRRQYWALKQVVKRAQHIIAVSKSTKNDILQKTRIAENKISVIPEASASTLSQPNREAMDIVLREAHLSYKQYLLYVGRLEHKKGIIEFLHTFDEYKKAQGIGDPLQLVLIGKFGFGEHDIKRTLQTLHRDDIHILGFVDDERMASLFAGARAFVFPTRYEGFGIPLLEAMQFQLPILTTDLPITHEVAGDSALYASYGDVGAWMHNIHILLRNKELEQQLIEAGKKQSLLFSWESTARATMDLLSRM